MPVHPAVRLRRHSLPYRSATRRTLARALRYSQTELLFNLCVNVLVRPTRISPRQSGAAGPCLVYPSGVYGKRPGSSVTRTAVQQRRPGRVPRFNYRGVFIITAAHTVPLCLGVCEGPSAGIAELSVARREWRVVSRSCSVS